MKNCNGKGCTYRFFHTHFVGLMVSEKYLVLYISVLYEYIYFSMHVKVEYREHLQF